MFQPSQQESGVVAGWNETDLKQELAEDLGSNAPLPRALAVPRYLQDVYWWAYVHPNAIRVFERQWLVNAILWGNFSKLRDAALQALAPVQGRVLQIACVYGDLTGRLADCLDKTSSLDVVDIVPGQLSNLQRKLEGRTGIALFQRNSAALGFPDNSYERTLLFFLLHEQPQAVRRQTLAEALRVTAPGGRIVIADYHCPSRWHPLYYLFRPVLALLEPYALDLWRNDIACWLPQDIKVRIESRRTFFGGLYQLLVLIRE